MLLQAVTELENKLLKLSNISYDSIDSLMRKIMKSYDITAKELHNAFKSKNKKTPDNWVKEKMKKLQEDHKEIASGKRQDDEGYMARNELDSIERAIKNLRKSIKSGNQQLPAWVQSKITKAADYIDTASEYL
jgi:thymidylate synthase